jgi:hypothetical protein
MTSTQKKQRKTRAKRKKPTAKKPAKMGAPTKFKPEYVEELTKFFDVDPVKIVEDVYKTKQGTEIKKEREVSIQLPTVIGFCRKIGITKKTLFNWMEKHEDLLHAYTHAKDIQENIWLQCGLKGLYQPTFAIFAGKNMFGWKDKQEHSLEKETLELIINTGGKK